MSNKQTLIKGATVLGLAGLIVKLLGAVFRLPLVNWIGDIGMANYGPAYNIYVFLLILATSGLPVAISKMVSESIAVGNHYQAHKVFKISSTMMICMGFVFFVTLYIFAPQFASLMNNPDSALGMRAISPALLLVPIMAAFRGYFQGMQNMRPTAVSEIIEQFCRVFAGLGAAYYLFFISESSGSYDKYTKGAAGANFGATAGAIGGLLIIAFIYYLAHGTITRRVNRSKGLGCEGTSEITGKILAIAVPITIGAGILPILNLVDSAVVMNRLTNAAGFTEEVAKGLYGQLSGFVGSLISLPQIITQAVGVSLVPIIAAAYKMKNKRAIDENVSMGIRISVIIGLPSAIGLIVLSKPILLMLYPRQAESAANAATILIVMSVGLIFLSVTTTLIGILQGIGKQMIPVKNLFIGMIAKIILTWILVGIPSINVNGAAIGTVAAYAISMMLNMVAVIKYTKAKINFTVAFLKPMIASGVMGAATFISYNAAMMLVNKNSLCTLISMVIAVIVYVFMVFITGAIKEDELSNLPKGDKIAKIVRKFSR